MLSEILLRMRRYADHFGGPRRIVVCPPALLHRPAMFTAGWRAGLRDWLNTGWNSAPVPTELRAARTANGNPNFDRVREEFLQSLADIRTQQAGELQGRIHTSRSLRDLWHLRPEVFKLVAIRFSQAEAQNRLDRLNRHFPTRSPRSGFAPLEHQVSNTRPPRKA